MLSLRTVEFVPYRTYLRPFLPVASRHISQHMLAVARYHSIFNHADISREHFWKGSRRSFSSSQTNKHEFLMNKTAKIGLFLLMSGFLITSVGLYAAEKKPIQQKTFTESELPTLISSKVLETIRDSNDIPGLKSEEFSSLKTEISNTWISLLKEGVLEISGTDKDVRPFFVAIQGVVEHVLASELQGNVKALTGIIHTPMPATPLCSKGEISKELVDPSIESDAARLFTVKLRTTIIRDYLIKGGVLYVVYPKGGYENRTEDQKKIYKQELTTYPNHLFDVPLNCESIPTELIGATYLFQDKFGNKFIFAIKMTQAKDPHDIGNFGLWFGSLYHPDIQERLRAVSGYMKQNDGHLLTENGHNILS